MHTWNWPWCVYSRYCSPKPYTSQFCIILAERIIVSWSCMSQAHVHVQWVVWLQLSQHTDSCSVMHIMYWAIQNFILSLSRKVWTHRYYPSRWIRLSTQQLDAQIMIDIPPSLLSYHDTQIIAQKIAVVVDIWVFCLLHCWLCQQVLVSSYVSLCRPC